MRTWRVQDTKARFSEVLNAGVRDGPQVITRRGIATAVLVAIEEWRRLQAAARPTLKELLLGEAPPGRHSGARAWPIAKAQAPGYIMTGLRGRQRKGNG